MPEPAPLLAEIHARLDEIDGHLTPIATQPSTMIVLYEDVDQVAFVQLASDARSLLAIADAASNLLAELEILILDSFDTRDTRPLTQPLYAWASKTGYPPNEGAPGLYAALLRLGGALGE